jgi:epoxyqueuosine reductase
MVEGACAKADEDVALPRLGVGSILVPKDVGASVLVDSYGFQGTMSSMTGAELSRLAEGLGLDAVGAAPVAPYTETERHIRERRARGLFADMQFTMARPEVSCHPETLLPGARTVVSAALCYYAPESEQPAGSGRLPRYTWRDAYADLRERLDALGRALGGEYRVLVDENDHVDREAAARAGVGFYGKNTLLITRRHGSWVVLGTLITEAELEATPPLGADCGECRLCIDACPTGALDEPGVLDSTRCLSYWTQSRASIPADYRPPLEDRVYGCDICQDVCPWNRGVEKRRAGVTADPAEPHVSLVDWLEAEDADLRVRYERLFVPRNDPRYLRRNALVALGNGGVPDQETRRVIEDYASSEDELLREHAEWALARLGTGHNS